MAKTALFIFIFFLAGSAFAEDYPAKKVYQGQGYTGDTPEQFCAASLANPGCSGHTFVSAEMQGGDTYVSCKTKTATGGSSTCGFGQKAYICPYGGTLTGVNGVYTCKNATPCPSGQPRDPVTGECKQNCPTGTASEGYYDIGTSPTQSIPSYACAGGCGVSFSGSCPALSGEVNGVKHYYCQGSYDYIPGGKVGDCTGDGMPGTSTPPADPNNCPQGQTKVGTRSDGTPICAKADNEQGDCKSGQTQVGTRADGSPICADNNPDKPKQGECGQGQTQVGTRADGSPICNNNGPEQGKCGAGQQQIGTRADGSPLCVAAPGDDDPDPGDDDPTSDPSPDPKTDDEKCEAPKVKDSNGNCVTPPEEGCDPATDPNKCEASMPENGTLWTRQDKTFATVYGDFKAKIFSAPIIQGAQGWINISVPSGSCPDMSVTVPYLNAFINLSEYFCSSSALHMLNLAGAVVLAAAAFAAFKWAFL